METKITLRLPKDLWEKLKKEASDNNRSLNSEIVYRLKKGVKAND